MSESSIAAIAIERKLPEELLASIVSLISPQCLRNLCRTCKTFSRIATPYLYAHVSLGQQVDYSSDYKQSPALVRFAYTIFSSPKYADLVKTVTVSDAWGVPGEYREVEPTSWPASGLELNEVLRKKCTEYAATEEGVDELYEKIASGENEDAILALLLASLPKLANLDINFGFHEEHSDFLKLLESSTDRVKLDKDSFPGFSVPVNVMVKGTDDRHPNNPVVMARMSRLPNIRALYGWKMGDSDGNWTAEGNHFATLKPRSCSVEYVELRDSKLHNRNLQLLLDATIPGTLKTFNYEIGCTWAWCNVQHLSIMASLRAHHDTLDSLGLSHEEFYPYQFGNEAEEPYPVTFKPFKVLTRLKIAPVYIWGDANLQDHASWTKTETHNMLCEALPESLQELWITRAEPQHSNPDATAAQFIPDCLLPALQLVIQQKSQICPKLRQLRIEFPLMNWDREWISLLASVCAEADTNGIRTTLRLTGLPRSIDDEKDDRERPWGWDEKVHWEKCVHNQESPKRWIQVGEQKCLGEMLLDLRAQLFELIGTITVAD